MIRPEKLSNALHCLQGVLVWARKMAHEDASSRDLAGILDGAEYLPYLIAAPTDETERFREQLVEIAARYRCAFVVEHFDGAAPPGWGA